MNIIRELYNIGEKRMAMLIRHAEREDIPSDSFGKDVNLTEHGFSDAEKFGCELASYPINRIYTSPVKRCVQTALQIKKGLGTSVEIVLSDSLGNPGFHVQDCSAAGRAYLEYGVRDVYEMFKRDEYLPGLSSKDYLRNNALSYIKRNTQEDGLTLFITHDALIANFACANDLADYSQQWVGYLDGVVIDCSDDAGTLKSEFTNYWSYLVLYAACTNNIFDMIESGCCMESVLAQNCHVHQQILHELLQSLVTCRCLKQRDDEYVLTSRGRLLTENHPQSLKYACMNWGAEHLTAWQNLEYTLKTGKPAFDHIYGMPFFEYISQSESKLMCYHRAMYEYAIRDYANLSTIIDWAPYHTIMDVGGGYGAIATILQESLPTHRIVLFDLPDVVAFSTNRNVDIIGGDFFSEIPNVADAIILSRVIHDWDDERALIILRNCYEALPKGGALMVIENCKNLLTDNLSFLSLNMQIMCNSHERTCKEYICLCSRSGFVWKQTLKANALQSLLIFEKNETI